ncbi:MAG: homoserine dehydrogenase, partial [Candidatus Bathyarchaeia archaeon]
PEFGKPHITASDLLELVEAEILVEATSSNLKNGEPSLTYIHKALILGMDLITANKGAIARGLSKLKAVASLHGTKLFYEATVGGGAPILSFVRYLELREGVSSIQGVLNGTTNYILWRMEKGLTLDEALTEAQKLGYAEKNYNYDIKGLDTACKLTILANSVLNQNLSLEDVYTSGIEDLTPEEIERARRRGCSIRLIGSLDCSGAAEVKPKEVPKTDYLCVDSVNNAVKVSTKCGEYFLIGKGAGGQATACSLLRDLTTLIKERLKTVETLPHPIEDM